MTKSRGGARPKPFLLLHPAAATNTIEMATEAKPELARQVFTTSRELEYFSEAELVTQTGYSKAERWPGVLVKELLDNALDVCEQAGIAPEIRVEFTGDSLAITDNGPGIPPAVVERILDFATRTSDKGAYVSPTRGAQGNALKTVLAIPYVLDGGRPSVLTIEAQGIRHVDRHKGAEHTARPSRGPGSRYSSAQRIIRSTRATTRL